MLKKSRRMKGATNSVFKFPPELVERNKKYLETLNQKEKLGKTYSKIEQQIDQGLIIQRDDNRTENEKIEDKFFVQKRLQEIVNILIADNLERSKLLSMILQSNKSEFVIRFAPQIIKTIKDNYNFVNADLAEFVISTLEQSILKIMNEKRKIPIYGRDFLEEISKKEVSLGAEEYESDDTYKYSSKPTEYLLDDEDMMRYNLKKNQLNTLTKKELITYAKSQNIKINKKATKSVIIDDIIISGKATFNSPIQSGTFTPPKQSGTFTPTKTSVQSGAFTPITLNKEIVI